ncbi:TMEM175 family protein [Companilactobacillus metriopterae]|uniref:TMEM175 family protein n=1 Tax=Companilactobacillus metriopterae TaxID=1909267 RepID=UPI00100BDE3B|nr:TMEM175 family protein [Companilactobacillus metriopterae]
MFERTERFEAFTDAVVAIILTILVLEIHLPDNDHSVHALMEMAIPFFSYIITFIFIATMWVNHHLLFNSVDRIDYRIICSNIVLLFFTSLLPATTAWMGSDINSVLSSSLYVINVILFNLSSINLKKSVMRINDIPKMGQSLQKEWISLAINCFTLIVTLFIPFFPLIGLLSSIFFWFIPVRSSKAN